MLGAKAGTESFIGNPVATALVRLGPNRLFLVRRRPVILAGSLILPLRLIAPVGLGFRLVFLVSGIRLRLFVGFGLRFLLFRRLFLFLLVFLLWFFLILFRLLRRQDRNACER